MHTDSRPQCERSSTRERGSILPFIALAMVLAGASMVLLARIGGAATARAEARNAADAAALAGAAEGRAAAVALAQANGAELLSYADVGLDTLVRVRLGPAEATGRARRTGDRDDGSTVDKAVAPALRAALARAEQLLGQPVPVTSGARTGTEKAGAPELAMHERGLAVDVPSDFVTRLLAIAAKAGLCDPDPVDDPVHFEVCQ